MSGKTQPLILLGIGAVLLYVAYTGRMQGIWDGLTGKLDRPPGATPTPPTSDTSNGVSTGPPIGGMVSPFDSERAVYYVTATGEMMLTDAGIY